ncbi:23S rRNA pseudouridine(2604) synthase RluF [Paenibacillus aestuarii]|uniref:Pseudouridine synthase n=1 Tax=Paenibacillus aestuarii TaxID=516965 RepID=A0ABW0KB13_9BACL|nr:23S rRNA pseudouridine(2604) synthase RluF [Paenibacillus aestuarii]
MRINKFISETGVCSRREADKWVEAGRVSINGVRATLGSVVDPGDDVRIDGRKIGEKKEHVYIALNKPVGITSTTEAHVKGNIVDFVGHEERIFPIGRLDKDSEGLILLTNNGDIVNQILRAENNHDKEYIVTVNKPVTPMFLQGMASGVKILGTTTKPCEVYKVGDRVFRIILTQGLNRQIRRMCEAFGYRVTRLQRVRIMHIHLGNLKLGQWRDLTKGEMQDLMRTLSKSYPGTDKDRTQARN